MSGDEFSTEEFLRFLGEQIAQDPANAIEKATERLDADLGLEACCHARILMSRGSAYRTIGELDLAEEDFHRAESKCLCPECNPRLLRRRAPLLMMRGDVDAALAAADEAVLLFTLRADTEWIMRARASRGTVRFYAGRPDEALEDAAAAYSYFSQRVNAGPLHYGCAAHEFALLLMTRGEWESARRILTAPALKYVNGYDVLRLRLRWCLILCEMALELIDSDTGGTRIEAVLKQLQGRSLPVHAEQAQIVRDRVERAKLRNVLHIAALTADAAYFGRMREVSKGARAAMRLLSPDAQDLRRNLADLADLAETDTPDVEHVRRVALDIRAQCPGAPPLPPSLQTATEETKDKDPTPRVPC